MKFIRIFTLQGVNFFLIIFLFAACIEDDFSDVALDESVRWQPDISFPLGEASLNVNNYFSSLSVIDTFPIDTFFVFFQDSLHRLNIPAIEITENINFAMKQVASDPSFINYLKIKIIIDNSYPTRISTQLYFNDGNDKILDSLFADRKLIQPAEVTDEGISTSPVRKIIEVELDASRIDEIYQTESLYLYGLVQLSNENLDKIHFYKSYNIKIQLGLQAGLDIEPSI